MALQTVARTDGFGLLELPEDKLILKAKLYLAGSDIVPNLCSPTVTNSPLGHTELLKDIMTMLESGFAHDVTFSLGGKTIPALTAVLCCRSPVYAKMLQHDMLEKSSIKVVIRDIDFEIFNSLLLFLCKWKKRIGKLMSSCILWRTSTKWRASSENVLEY